MAHDQPTLENQQDLVEMLTRRSEAFLTASNKATAKVGELMRAQLTRDLLLADCIAPLQWLHRLASSGLPVAAPPLTEVQCLELLARIEALKVPVSTGQA